MKSWNTEVVYGESLKHRIQPYHVFRRRLLIEELKSYLFKRKDSKVCGLYGLRRTGKTTMMYHALLDMTEDQFSKSAYILLHRKNTIYDLDRDLDQLRDLGFRYIFVDEITLLEDFMDISNIYADSYVQDGLRLVLTGTDSLGFYLTSKDGLYDRIHLIHSTYIPFYEFSYLVPDSTVDTYIEYGGTLISEKDYKNPFYDISKSREYLDSAICQNIQNSLENYRDGREYGRLATLFQVGELTDVFQRNIQQKNRTFLLRTIQRRFKSSDYGSARQIFERREKMGLGNNLLQNVDESRITKNLKNVLDILEMDERKEIVQNVHLSEATTYLQALDVLQPYTVQTFSKDISRNTEYAFTQPGLRYSLTKELIEVLKQDKDFSKLSLPEQKEVLEVIKNDVKGQILEEIIITQMQKSVESTHNSDLSLYQAVFMNCPTVERNGEIDVVFQDAEHYTADLYEIKHSSTVSLIQTQHLEDSQKLKAFQDRGLTISTRNVLYEGVTQNTSADIHYINAEEFLHSYLYKDPNYDRWKMDLNPQQQQVWKALQENLSLFIVTKDGDPIRIQKQGKTSEPYDSLFDVIDDYEPIVQNLLKKGCIGFPDTVYSYYGLKSQLHEVQKQIIQEGKNPQAFRDCIDAINKEFDEKFNDEISKDHEKF